MGNKKTSPMGAIRQKCIDCMCDQLQEIRACSVLECSLWRFRLGINPNCGNNSKNPLLQPKYFEGRHNMKSHELLKLIKYETNGGK